MTDPLDPLLRPRSIALVGASPRPGSYGNGMVRGCLEAGFAGAVHLVNPKYDQIAGCPCHASLDALPEVPDHAVLMIANERVEQVVADAIRLGVRAVTMFGSLQLDDGNPVPLADRIRQMAQASGLIICGANGSGFYNRAQRLRCKMGGHGAQEPGPVTLISQSGSLGSAIEENDGRLCFNLTVSTGQELTTDVSDYMHFALGLDSTRAIGLCIETIRKPDRFVAALAHAQDLGVPVVMLKVAKSEKGKRFAVSHSGALAGDNAVYEAVMRKHGGICVDDPDELVATLQLLTCGRRATRDGIVAITDSGGERELLADIATDRGVDFAEISGETRRRLSGIVEYGIEPENPLDAWGTGHGYKRIFGEAMETMLADPQAGLGIWVADLRAGHSYYEGFAETAMDVATRTSKPLAFATCFSKGRNEALAQQLAAVGIPLLEGMRPAMVAVHGMLDFCNRQAQTASTARATPSDGVLRRWRARLEQPQPLGESEGLALLSDFGIPVVPHRRASDEAAVLWAAEDLGYPVVLKTAQPDMMHKSERGGVVLRLRDAPALTEAYARMQAALGPDVLVAAMAAPGIELALGGFHDPQFGSMMMAGAGGVLIELLRDTGTAVPPLDRDGARRLIDGLRLRPLLDGYRGTPPGDIEALVDAMLGFSDILHHLGDLLGEADVNPLIVSAQGVVAVDALFVPSLPQRSHEEVEHA